MAQARKFSALIFLGFISLCTSMSLAQSDLGQDFFFNPDTNSSGEFKLNGPNNEVILQELRQRSEGSAYAPTRLRQRPQARPAHSSELVDSARARITEPNYRNRDDINETVSFLPKDIRGKVTSAGIPRVPLSRALEFRQRMIEQGEEINERYLTVSDLTRDARKDRMWLIDLETGEVTGYKTAHGAGGGNNANCANRFGNKPDSNATPGGAFIFGCQFDGSPIRGKRRPRRSMVMKGMDEENANSWNREVIFHEGIALRGNEYTTAARGGRSSGCLTIELPLYQEFVDKVSQEDRCDNLADMTPQGGAPVYVYPERSDVVADRPVYWDSTCKATLESSRLRRIYLDD